MDPEKIDNIKITAGVDSVDATMPKTIQKSDTNLDDVVDNANVITPKEIINVDGHIDTKKRKLKSAVWNHFTKQKSVVRIRLYAITARKSWLDQVEMEQHICMIISRCAL